MADEDENYCELHCQEVFVLKSSAMRAMYALLGISLTVFGTSVTYAISTARDLTKVQTEVAAQQSEVAALRAKYESIDTKLDLIYSAAQSSNQMLSQRKSQPTR
jgi:hypothetical protein